MNRRIAIGLLKGYLAQVFQATGQKWDSDNDAEVTYLVDALIAAARFQTCKPSPGETTLTDLKGVE